jgi:hypothetical protein
MEENCGGRGGCGNYLWVCADLTARPIKGKIHSTNNNNFLHYTLDINIMEKKTSESDLLSNFHVIFKHKRISGA